MRLLQHVRRPESVSWRTDPPSVLRRPTMLPCGNSLGVTSGSGAKDAPVSTVRGCGKG